MCTDKICEVLEILVEHTKTELETNYENVDTCELGKVVDMIKDLSASIYYCNSIESHTNADIE